MREIRVSIPLFFRKSSTIISVDSPDNLNLVFRRGAGCGKISLEDENDGRKFFTAYTAFQAAVP